MYNNCTMLLQAMLSNASVVENSGNRLLFVLFSQTVNVNIIVDVSRMKKNLSFF